MSYFSQLGIQFPSIFLQAKFSSIFQLHYLMFTFITSIYLFGHYKVIRYKTFCGAFVPALSHA